MPFFFWSNPSSNQWACQSCDNMHVSVNGDAVLNWPDQRAYWGRRRRRRPRPSCCCSFYLADEPPPHQSSSPGLRATWSCEVCICVPIVESCHHQKSGLYSPSPNLTNQTHLSARWVITPSSPAWHNCSAWGKWLKNVSRSNQLTSVVTPVTGKGKEVPLRRTSLKLWRLVLQQMYQLMTLIGCTNLHNPLPLS